AWTGAPAPRAKLRALLSPLLSTTKLSGGSAPRAPFALLHGGSDLSVRTGSPPATPTILPGPGSSHQEAQDGAHCCTRLDAALDNSCLSPHAHVESPPI